VVFVLNKFCEPHAFDYVPLSKALAEAKIPHLLLETDITVPVGQLRTRLQAFLEMLVPPRPEGGETSRPAAAGPSHASEDIGTRATQQE